MGRYNSLQLACALRLNSPGTPWRRGRLRGSGAATVRPCDPAVAAAVQVSIAIVTEKMGGCDVWGGEGHGEGEAEQTPAWSVMTLDSWGALPCLLQRLSLSRACDGA